MIRGTTPELRFELPFDASEIDDGFITIAQRGRPNMDVPIARCEVDGDALVLLLTQEETLRLRPMMAVIQLRVKMGDRVLASEMIEVDVGAILKEGMI